MKIYFRDRSSPTDIATFNDHTNSPLKPKTMNLFNKSFKWIMLVSGLLTCTMFQGLFFPQTLLESNFGEGLQGPLAEIIVRNWSALIGLVGCLLIYGAFVESARGVVLVLAGASKTAFIALVLIYGKQYLGFGIGTAIILDSFWVALYLVYLLARSYKNSTTG